MKDEKWLDSSENIDDDERTTMNSICGTITHGPTLIVPFCRNFHWLMISDCIWAVWVICNSQIPALAWLTGVQIIKNVITLTAGEGFASSRSQRLFVCCLYLQTSMKSELVQVILTCCLHWKIWVKAFLTIPGLVSAQLVVLSVVHCIGSLYWS